MNAPVTTVYFPPPAIARVSAFLFAQHGVNSAIIVMLIL